MRTHKTQENHILRLNQEIDILKELLEFHKNVYLPTLQKFDGKVYNKRFVNALKEQVTNNLMLIRDKDYNEIVIELRLATFSYNESKQMYCKVILNNEGRIDYNATINNDLAQKWVENISTQITEIKGVINNYNEYMEFTKQFQEQINKFAELPYQFRENIALDKIWYLK